MTQYGNEKTYALFSTPNNKKLIADLEARGASIIKIPKIETMKIDVEDVTLEQLLNIKQFDWIVFADVLAVDYFLQILEEKEVDLFDLDDVRICAFGEAVSDRLRFVQIHTDVLPTKIDKTEIVEALKNYVSGENALREQKILIIHRENQKVFIAENLLAENAEVNRIAIYRVFFEDQETVPKLRALIAGGAVDEFIFSAPEDVIYLEFLLSCENIEADLFERFSATDETTFKTLYERGIKPRFFQK